MSSESMLSHSVVATYADVFVTDPGCGFPLLPQAMGFLFSADCFLLVFHFVGTRGPVVFFFFDRAEAATRGGTAVRGSGDSISSSPAMVRSTATCNSFLWCSFSG
ncbi:hypothetical protein MRB53_026032 [Persea americana]|uniref:Uncharacterized protein n=1 Tax=Persea americana TaxID=3435 RepID=A0ACC2LGW7_PERAE|nr:hypothetical protein MRB53_026032 [Persea americana]